MTNTNHATATAPTGSTPIGSGHRRRKVLVGALALVAAAGTAAAFWSAVGSGTGGGQSAAAAVDVVINQTSTVTGLAPGAPAQPLEGTFTNPNTAPVYVGAVTAEVTSVKVDGVVVDDACAADYVIGGTASVEHTVVTGTTWEGLTLRLKDSGINQDACKGAVVGITYTAIAS